MWTIPELENVVVAVIHMSIDMGGKAAFRKAMAGTRIDKFSFYTGGMVTEPHIVYLFGDFANGTPEDQQYIVIHEFGHIWDVNTIFRLGRGIRNRVLSWANKHGHLETPPGIIRANGTRKADDNAREDWAESFASYVLDTYWYFAPPDHLKPIRKRFIDQQIRELQ